MQAGYVCKCLWIGQQSLVWLVTAGWKFIFYLPFGPNVKLNFPLCTSSEILFILDFPDLNPLGMTKFSEQK